MSLSPGLAPDHLDPRDFAHVRVWVFDLDNTLYPPQAALFAQMQPRITAFVCRVLGLTEAEADALRDAYWHRYGTTLRGLMAEHGLDPAEYLRFVHDLDLSALSPDPVLARRIAALPGRRIVFTNGDGAYAARVLAARGLSGVFDAVYGVEHAGWLPKPDQAAFEAVFALDGLSPEEGAFFDDDPRNLLVPHRLGMRTVLVAPERPPHAHVHHHAADLSAFLARLI
ncbi:pyrimidine 5'-nucleotidase [Rubellimicrobium thermophilum DSM 16684]|uniref:Pyrimidine 5'-nucleotidase n=1 Tax=Rubellimicrobium thermophilum DSM 16684 TaxID=1123069 RepID=S9R6W5_9RHOB|nr:pyrimidine 5'-nucleotidase [Rubellimicrobium thermophilum]EPX87607.1 pyrimidine 5'-nucleotidase [Rubellimicrobium thermophilum DSM 16684]